MLAEIFVIDKGMSMSEIKENHEHACNICGGHITVQYIPESFLTEYYHYFPDYNRRIDRMVVTDEEFVRIGNSPTAIRRKIESWERQVHEAD